jgi:hypothetical protein
MKKILCLIGALMLTQISAWACTVCKTQQPKLLQGVTHGAGPQSNWDYVIIAAMVVIVMGTLTFSIRLLVLPGETNHDHIKHTILNPPSYE